MRYRAFGRTDLEVSEIGFGAWAIGGQSYGPVDRRESLRALAVAEELGCNFVDTAAVYGDSESVLGEFLQGRRDKWLVATKYSGQRGGVLNTAEDQLRRLGIDVIDFYQLHWAPSGGKARLYEDLYRLRDTGKVRFIGVSLYSEAEIDYVLERTLIDGFQVPLSLISPLPLLARLNRIGPQRPAVVVRSSLESGFLTGKFRRGVRFPDTGDHRRDLTPARIERMLDLVEAFRFLERPPVSLTQAAARYPLSFPEVSTVILGTKTVGQAEQNFGGILGDGLRSSDLEMIAQVQRGEGLLRVPAVERLHRVLTRVRRLLPG